MATQHYDQVIGENIPANYERYFVPTIGAPLAIKLVEIADLQQGERVLDVACGTGVVARLAAEEVGAKGRVAGVDVNPGMLAVARSMNTPGAPVEWHEANAESMPLPDEAFDVVFCQMGLQFMPDKVAALQEMRRVLTRGGRMLLNVPGPVGAIFSIMADAMERHVGSEAAGFVHQVFSLYEVSELRQLANEAGFHDVTVDANPGQLHLPPPKEFFWQYVQGTPLAIPVAEAGDDERAALERDVVAEWKKFEEDGAMTYEQNIVVVTARK